MLCMLHYPVSLYDAATMMCILACLLLTVRCYDVLICWPDTQICWWAAALAHVPWQTQPDLHRAEWTLLQCEWYLSPWGIQVSHSAHGGVWHCPGQTGLAGDAHWSDLVCVPSVWGGNAAWGKEVLRHWLGRWDRYCTCSQIFTFILTFIHWNNTIIPL